jgi:hypothetical protein
MRVMQLASILMLAGLCWVAPVRGDDAATTNPATSQPQANGPMKIYITAVSGLVQVRDGDSQPWQAAVAKMIISEGAELRTGPHSSVTCVIPPDQTFTLDRLGTVKVAEAARHGDKITTDLIMKYGRTHYDIEGAGLEHEASIISPSSTLAVRGTNVTLFDQPPYLPEATSFTGRAAFTYGHSTIAVGQKNGTFAQAQGGADGASQTALNNAVVDPHYTDALTAADAAFLATEVAHGAVVGYDPVANIPVVTGGMPAFDSQLPATLPGQLDFVLRWTGDAWLNIEVGVDEGNPLNNILTGFQQGEFLYPGYGYQNSASGGHIPFEDKGGPTGGEEIAYWLNSYPTGLYGLAAQGMSGATTSFTLNVFANGVPLNMYYFGTGGTLIKSTQVTRTISPGQFFAVLALVPPSPLLEFLTPDDPLGNPNPGINAGSFSAVPAVAGPAVQRAQILTPSARIANGGFLPAKGEVPFRH